MAFARRRRVFLTLTLFCTCIVMAIMLYRCNTTWTLADCEPVNYKDKIKPFLSLTHKLNSTSKYVVPNIAHFNWYSSEPKELLFHELLSLLSAHRIMKADKIFFHHDTEPYGQYWEEAKRKIPNLVLIQRDPPNCLFGSKLLEPPVETSNSDADRIFLMLEFGGVFLDLDILITNSLDPLRIYPTTVGLERANKVCGGFIMSAPHSAFMYIWMNSMLDDYNVYTWAYISGDIPTELITRFHESDIVHVEPTRIHHPNYFELDYLIGHKPYDWSKNYAVHLWYRKWRGKDRFPTAESIKKMDSTFGQIARKIYYGSSDFL